MYYDQLEYLTIEIVNPHSKPFLVGTLYRPPKSSPDLFVVFEDLINKIDAENLESYLFGDLNCNYLESVPDQNTLSLMNIFEVYGLTQLITEPTRISQTSQTLIHLSVTNSPDKVTRSGILSLGVSDHSLVYIIRKAKFLRSGTHKIIGMKNLKNFNKNNFFNDLLNQNWTEVSQYSEPNAMCSVWK